MAGGRTSFFTRMRLLKRDIQSRRDAVAGRLFLPVEKYVRGCTYTTYKGATRFVELVLGGYSDDQVAERLGVSNNTVRWREHELSCILYNIFGEDFFDMMKEPEEHMEKLEKLVYLTKVDCRREEYVPIDVIASVNEAVSEEFKLDSMGLEDCLEEISFLAKYSIPGMVEELAGLDEYKLEYLFRVLEGSAGTLDDRFVLLKELEG